MQGEVDNLRQELVKTRERIARLEKELEVQPDYGLGEGDPGIVRWELNRALLEETRERAARLEKALVRLNAGQYGICERCGNPIHPERLAILPDARLCIDCARQGRRS